MNVLLTADTPEGWITEFQLDSIFQNNFSLMIKLSANYTYMICLQVLPKLPANVASNWFSRLNDSGVSASLRCLPSTPFPELTAYQQMQINTIRTKSLDNTIFRYRPRPGPRNKLLP